jgi:hypothetical protein
MTPRTVVATDFAEIPSLTVSCECGGSLTIPIPNDSLARHAKCPGCNAMLWKDNNDKTYLYVLDLMRSLSNWKRSGHAAFKLGFAITKEQ